jgi:hypothetical protein
MRAFSGVAQHLAEAVHGLFKRQIVVNEGVSRPDTLAKFLTRDDFLWVLQQGLQYWEGLACKLLSHASLANLPGQQIYFKDPELYHPGGLAGDGCHLLTPSRMRRSLSHLVFARMERVEVTPGN